MSTSPPYTVKIISSFVTVIAGTLKISNSVGRRSQASFTVKTDLSTFFDQYEQVFIYDGSNTLTFSGYISQVTTTAYPIAGYATHQVSCTDQHFLADKRVYYATFTNRTAGVIVTAILNNILSQEGVTVGQIYDGLEPSPTLYPSATLYPSGTGQIPNATFYYNTVAQALDQLAQQAGISGTPYYWMIDQNKKLYFVPYTTIVNSTVVDGTNIDIKYYPPQITRQNPTYRNKQYITGGVSQIGPVTETRTGDGKLTSWTMAYDLALAPIITLNNIPVSVGIQGSGQSQYYWSQGSKVITQDSSQTKLTSSDTLSITYTGQYPSTAYLSNQQQITAQAAIDGSSGIIENVYNDNTLTTANNALLECSALLNRNCNRGIQFKFTTLVSGYAPGQLITVNISSFWLTNQQMLIEQIDIEDKDGLNIWFTITAVSGAFDTNWVNFFSKLLQYNVPQNSINSGSNNVVFAAPYPSSTLYPSPTLFP